MVFKGNGCCRFNALRAKTRGYHTEGSCIDLCRKDKLCVGADIARPKGGKFDCFSFYRTEKEWSGNNFEGTGCPEYPEGKCFKKEVEHSGGGCQDSDNTKFGIYSFSGKAKHYLKVCGNNQATSQTSVGGWCEQFFLEPQGTDSYGLYTKDGNAKYYLKICDNALVTSQTSAGGWCEKAFLDRQADGTYGIYTKENDNKYYLKICDNGQVTSQASVGGWCEKFYFEQAR